MSFVAEFSARTQEMLLKRALESEPANPEMSYGLGMLYARKDQPGRAIELLESAIKLRPEYSDALNNLGVLLLQRGQVEEAIDRAPTTGKGTQIRREERL